MQRNVGLFSKIIRNSERIFLIFRLARIALITECLDSTDKTLSVFRRSRRVVMTNYRFQWQDMDWYQDKSFNEYLRSYGELFDLNTHGRWMLWQLLRMIRGVPGGTAECGVFKEAGSHLICERNEMDTECMRWHFGFDSFEGLSAPAGNDGAYWRAGDLCSDIDIALINIRRYS